MHHVLNNDSLLQVLPAEEKSQNRMICSYPKSSSKACRMSGGDWILLTLMELGSVGNLTGKKMSGPVILTSRESTIGPYSSVIAVFCGKASDLERLMT